MKNLEQKDFERERYIEELVSFVESEFEKRRKERLFHERQWELNMKFFAGDQYCDVDSRGEILDESKTFYWQNRGVFNHIAPIVDMRIAKLATVVPTLSVRPKTDDDKDVVAASLAEKLIESAVKKTGLNDVVKKVTAWSETCGTGFYKIIWDANGGNVLGSADNTPVYEGEVSVLPVSPFEIFPDSLNNETLGDCKSIIHAKAMYVDSVKEKYGVMLAGDKIDVTGLTKKGSMVTGEDDSGVIENAVVVMEMYERPSIKYPNGRMLTVAGGKLLYAGDLPYKNGESGARDFPFVKQDSLTAPGNFFGTSVIERLIPIQRAYNAVKNRKHEFLNRLSMGVMTVEDGSVDVDDLAEEGLSPGKVLVYRQGAKAPEMMSDITMPSDFSQEEEKLLNEFVVVSGVSNVTSSSSNASLSSGTALEILVEQDNARLIITADRIRQSYLDIAKQIIRLYSQFLSGIRAIKVQDEFNKTKILYADKRAADSDDVYLVNENELLYTARQKKQLVFQLYESGILADDEGRLRPEIKEKVLALLGYKELDYQKGLSRLHEDKAEKENELLRKKDVSVDEIDDNAIHIDEHTRYVLSEFEWLDDLQKQRFYAHISEHKQKEQNKQGMGEN